MDTRRNRALSRAWAGGVVAALVLGAGLVAARMQPASATASGSPTTVSASPVAGAAGGSSHPTTVPAGRTGPLGQVSAPPAPRPAPSAQPAPRPAPVAPAGQAQPAS